MMLFQIHIMRIIPGLLDEMAAVGSCIYQHVLRPGFQPAFYHGLEIFIFDLEIFEAQIVHIYYEPVVSVLYPGNHSRQILELMLIYLDHPESLIVVLIDQRLDGGGFTCARISEEEAIIGTASVYEGLRIIS